MTQTQIFSPLSLSSFPFLSFPIFLSLYCSLLLSLSFFFCLTERCFQNRIAHPSFLLSLPFFLPPSHLYYFNKQNTGNCICIDSIVKLRCKKREGDGNWSDDWSIWWSGENDQSALPWFQTNGLCPSVWGQHSPWFCPAKRFIR